MNGIFALEDLHRKILEVPVDVVDQRVGAVTARVGAPAAGCRLHHQVALAVPARVFPGDGNDHRVAVVCAGGPFRHHGGKGLDHQVDQQAQGGEIPCAGCRFARVENRLLRRFDLKGAERSAVYRIVGTDQQLERYPGGGDRLGKTAVHGTPRLRAGAFEVDRHGFVFDGRGDHYRYGTAVETVVVEPALGPVPPVPDAPDRPALTHRRLLEDGVPGGGHPGFAEPLEQRTQPLFPGASGRDLGIEVADQPIAEAAVAAQHIDDVFARRAVVVELGGAPAHAFLVDLHRVHGSARVLGAHVQPVCAGRGETDPLAAPEDGHDHRGIVQVRTGHVRVVHVEDIAVREVAPAVPVGDELYADFEVSQEQRQPGRLAQNVGLGVQKGNGAVFSLVDDGRERAAYQRRVHVVGNGVERIANDLGGYGVDGVHWAFTC